LNSYLMSLQTKMIVAMTECQYIFVVNAQRYFHQWQMRIADRNKLTVVSHWEQKQFSMTVMRFKNSLSYVQRQINKILRSHWVYAKVYMNNIVIFSHTLKKHLKHLHVIFSLFRRLRVCLTSTKSFLEYSFVSLLEQKINGFKLTTSTKKLVVISSFRFSQSLKKLEMYIKLIEYLRNYVSYYAQMTESLQKRKTALSKEVSKDLNNARKTKTLWIFLVNSIKKKLNVFQLLQKQFRKLSVLTHYNSNLSLYVNLNTFKVYDFNAIVYHIIDEKSRSILFLSKELNFAERNYWSTELKIVDVVWVVHQMRHMIEFMKKSSITMYTDHSTTISIARQISLFFFNTDKLNLRLVWTSQYLFTFELNIRYKFDNKNLILNALSRLLRKRSFNDASSIEIEEILEFLHTAVKNFKNHCTYAFAVSLVEMSANFRQRLLQAMKIDKHWKDIIINIKADNMKASSWEDYFDIKDDLLYHIDQNSDRKSRLMISKALEEEIFKLAHRSHHVKFHWTYQHITESLYIRKLLIRLWKFIEHCLNCLLYQTRRHQLYEELQLIRTINVFFHTITMNFVIALSISQEEYDCMLIIIDKFFKWMMMISSKTTYAAEQWAHLILERLQIVNWSISIIIINDRDSKFMSDFWKTTFKKLRTSILISIVYHSQMNEQFERINQTVEIALRFLLSSIEDSLWLSLLSTLQVIFDNSEMTIEHSSNKVIYEFRTTKISNLIQSQRNSNLNFVIKRFIYYLKVIDVIFFAVSKAKAWYDKRHKSMILKKDSFIFLRLHRKYHLSSYFSWKLSQQYCKSFQVQQKVNKLVYKLKLSAYWWIHSIILIAQLKLIFKEADSYDWSHLSHSDSVLIEDDMKKWSSYEIKKLVDKCFQQYERDSLIKKYLIQWKKYESEYDKWYDEDLLDNTLKLIVNYDIDHSDSNTRTHNRK